MKRFKGASARGFTLIEIMVVVVIIGVLVGLATPAILGRVDQSRVTGAKADIGTVGQALEMYRLDNHHYPSTDQGLAALISKPSGQPEPNNWKPGGYLKKKEIPRDPWGNELQYLAYPDGTFDLYSFGADGREGGSDYDTDIFHSDL